MMKRLVHLLILFTLSLLLIGCKSLTQNPLLFNASDLEDKKDSRDEEEVIDFNIEKISLSKSYQNIDPDVEIAKKGSNYKLLASLGLVESSGVKVKKVSKTGNQVNIYVENRSNKDRQLVVPNIIIDLGEFDPGNPDDIKFNIVNENYKPIKIRLSANEAINRVNADCKISTNTLPHIDIERQNDKYYWKLDYYHIFDRSTVDNPIINLFVVVDADNGDIITLDKDSISSYIDDGHILDFIPHKYILYKKVEERSKSDPIETLWMYNIENQEKRFLYTSSEGIISAKFHPEEDKIAFLEKHKRNNQLFIIELTNERPYKVSFQLPINPRIIQWKDKNQLYLVDRLENKSIIYEYSLVTDTSVKRFDVDKEILDLKVQGDYFLVLEEDLKSEETKISLTKNFRRSIYNDFGTMPQFINNNQISYIKSEGKKDRLYIYDIDDWELKDPLDLNVSNYFPLADYTLVVTEKNQNKKDYTLYEYNLKKDKLISIINIGDDKIILNQVDNKLYVNTAIPDRDESTHIIYSVDLSKTSDH